MILRTRSNTVATVASPSARQPRRSLLSRCQRQTDGTQDAVHESGGIVAPEALGEFDGLVDGRPNGRPIIHKDLPYRKTKDIAIDGADLVYGPLRRRLTDHIIDGGALGDHPLYE